MGEKKGKIDWLLLFSLILITNQAFFSLKIIGVLILFVSRFNLDFRFNQNRLPKFYLYIILLSTFTFFVITKDFSVAYVSAFIVGTMFWLFSLFTSHQVKLTVDRYGFEGVYRTIKAFTIIHFFACVIQIFTMISKTGSLNPYDNTLPFPYGMSAGDNLYGIFMENSYYSIMVSSMLAIFFLFQRNLVYTIVATACFTMIFGNFGTMIFVAVLLSLFFLGLLVSVVGRSSLLGRFALPRRFYWFIPVLLVFIIVLYLTVSPSNYQYLADKIREKIFRIEQDQGNSYATLLENQVPSEDAFKYIEIADFFGKASSEASIHSYASDFTAAGDSKAEITTQYIQKLQGKNLSLFETVAHLKSGVTPFVFGAGIARFSSSVAFKMSGLDSSRLFMSLPHYTSTSYENNHKMLIEIRESIGDDALKSTANWPDSLYNQILGEYGVLGAMLFLVTYLGYFLKRVAKLSYGIWLLLMLLPFAHLNYTFDTLCVIPFFELLVFADIKRGEDTINSPT